MELYVFQALEPRRFRPAHAYLTSPCRSPALINSLCGHLGTNLNRALLTHMCIRRLLTAAVHLHIMSIIEDFGRWARLKKYRIEVTYGVYVFTPGEKAVFWSIFSLIFGFITYYLALFLSRNVLFVVHSAWSLIHTTNGSSSASASHMAAGLTARLTQPAGSFAEHALSRSA